MIQLKKTTLTRSIVVLAIIFGVALAAGTWVTSAAGTVPEPGEGLCHEASPFSGDEAATLLTTSSGNGQHACGVFNVCGWGNITVPLQEYPGCKTTNLTVLCMNDNGQWVNNTVSNVGVAPDGSFVDFDVVQHKTCALFPAGSTPNNLQGGVISQ